MTQITNIVGIVLSLGGTLGLFRYGMPYRIRTDGRVLIAADGHDDAKARQTEVRYSWLSWIALGMIVLGAGCQVMSSAMQ